MWRFEIQVERGKPWEVLWWGASSEDVWETFVRYQNSPGYFRPMDYYAVQAINEGA